MVSAALEKDPAAPLNHDEEYTERTCIIVVQVNRRNRPISMGIVVDGVVGLSSSQKGGRLTDDKKRSSVPPGVCLSEQY